MRLPNHEHVSIPLPKLEIDLLSDTHLAGHLKAKFFRAVGCDKTMLGALQAGLVSLAQEYDVMQVVSSPHGTTYIIDDALSTPTGRVVAIRTMWILDTGQDTPRFVTAYPQ